jgi:hypothetical protein
VPSLQIAYVWRASVFTREVLNGLLRIGFLYPQQIIWNKGRTVLTRTHYWYQHEPCWYVRRKNAPWFGKAGENSTIWDSASPKFIMGGSDEAKFDHPTQKPVDLMRRPILNQNGFSPYDLEPSKDQFQGKLYILVRGGGGRDHTECRCVERSAGKAEVGVVQSIEQFHAKLQHDRTFCRLEVLECRQIPVVQPRTGPRVPAHGTEGRARLRFTGIGRLTCTPQRLRQKTTFLLCQPGDISTLP